MIFSCQISSQNRRSLGKKETTLLLRPDQKKGPIYMKVNVTGPKRKEFCCIMHAQMCFWCHQKKGHGETTATVRKRRIPSRVPFYSLFSIFPCVVCVPIWFHASRVIVKMNQEPLLLLSYPPVSPQAINSAAKSIFLFPFPSFVSWKNIKCLRLK